MQLSLFEDNRSGILLNIAHEFILARNLDQAVSVYEQLLADYPEDRHNHAQMKLVSEWRDILSGIDAHAGNSRYLEDIWMRLVSLSHPALRSAVLGILGDALHALPEPAQIYAPPRFHLGQILMEAGRYEEAADCFQAALSGNNIPTGRFLAWRGDALTLADKDDAALKSYMNAFLDDPLTVEIHSVKNRKITNLHDSLCFEDTDEIEEDQEPAWLPVWGWLQGLFPLPLQPFPEMNPAAAAEFEARLEKNDVRVPRLWFDMLTHAERLRITHRDDRELAAVRRLMKRSNGFSPVRWETATG